MLRHDRCIVDRVHQDHLRQLIRLPFASLTPYKQPCQISFSCSSVLACVQVADFLGTKHHELHFTVQEGLDCLHDLIYHLESFEQVLPAISLPLRVQHCPCILLEWCIMYCGPAALMLAAGG